MLGLVWGVLVGLGAMRIPAWPASRYRNAAGARYHGTTIYAGYRSKAPLPHRLGAGIP